MGRRPPAPLRADKREEKERKRRKGVKPGCELLCDGEHDLERNGDQDTHELSSNRSWVKTWISIRKRKKCKAKQQNRVNEEVATPEGVDEPELGQIARCLHACSVCTKITLREKGLCAQFAEGLVVLPVCRP